MMRETIIVAFDTLADPIIRRLMLLYENHHVHIVCDVCGQNIFVGIGRVRNDSFIMVYDHPTDKMNNVYTYRCPACESRVSVRATKLRMLHANKH